MEFRVRRKNYFVFSLNHVLTRHLECTERKNSSWHLGTVTFTATFPRIKPLRTKYFLVKSISADKPGRLLLRRQRNGKFLITKL